MTTATTSPFQINDPVAAPTYGDGPLSRWCKRALYEPRDEVFVRLALKVAVLMSIAMFGLFEFFRWALVPVYLALWAWYVPRVILMLHCTMHRPFIRRPKWLARAYPYVMSFLFGIPTGYTEHHMGMHHVEDNMGEDLSSTLRYRRDSFLHFLAYWARFFFFILPELTLYLSRHRRTAMARRALVGELTHQALMVGLLFVELALRPGGLHLPHVRRALHDDGWKLGPARLHQYGAEEQRHRQLDYLHQQRLQQALLQRRLPHRPPLEGQPALDGDAAGLHRQP